MQFPHYIPLIELESTGLFRMLADRSCDGSPPETLRLGPSSRVASCPCSRSEILGCVHPPALPLSPWPSVVCCSSLPRHTQLRIACAATDLLFPSHRLLKITTSLVQCRGGAPILGSVFNLMNSAFMYTADAGTVRSHTGRFGTDLHESVCSGESSHER